MQLTDEHLKTYADQGYLFFQNCFSKTEVERVKSELPSIYNQKDTAEKIIEADGTNVRIVFGSHTNNEVFRCLAHHPRLVKPVMQILGTSVYIHQHSINAKVALEGDVFRWHQDSTYHKEQDGILRSNLVVTMVFLDEVNEFNGPLMIIPCSHKDTSISIFENRETFHTHNHGNFNSQFKKSQFNLEVERGELERLVREYGIVAPKGAEGSVLFFHPSCVHGSSCNMYPFDRTVVVSVYNSVENLPVKLKDKKPRPEFLASRDYRPIEPLSDDVLLT